MRRKRIIHELSKQQIIYIKSFTSIFPDTSLSTIRRDLNDLNKQGLIVLLKGGAVQLNTVVQELSIEEKERLMVNEKNKIGKYASTFIKDGFSIYIDSGTSTGAIIRHILKKHITVFTSNTNILPFLQHAEFDCTILGGEIRKGLGSVVGCFTEHMIEELNFDIAFIGTSGISEKYGYTTPSLLEASKKKKVMAHSKKSYILADHTKFDKVYTHTISNIKECTLLSNREYNFKSSDINVIVI